MDNNNVFIKKKNLSVSEILNDLNDGKIRIVEEFPNRENWDQHKKSRFIEAILLGIQLKEFYMRENQDNTLDLVDSQERIKVLRSYLNDEFPMVNLYNLPQYNNMTFENLPVTMRNKLREHRILAFIIDKSSYREPADYMCKRINQGMEVTL